MSTVSTETNAGDAIAPNAYRLLWAGFMAILAAGVGFSVRGGILGQWANQFGFSMTELGLITGGGLTGFGIVIILSSLIADKVGYGKLMIGAFLCHVASAVLTYMAPSAFASGGKEAAFSCLSWGMFLFAVGNGFCEAVVNPLTRVRNLTSRLGERLSLLSRDQARQIFLMLEDECMPPLQNLRARSRRCRAPGRQCS